MENKFYKISHEGGTFVVGTFFNPITKEVKTEVLRDYDYADCSRDNDELYYMPINEQAKRMYLHLNGVILVGDTVEVVKGRKMPIGYVGVVKAIYPYRDCYGRIRTQYLYFEDGQKTNVDNCKLILQKD